MKECLTNQKKEEAMISVVIPCYNAANIISYALDSLVEQSFKAFKVIIVDDGSTDNSIEIINRYMDRLDIQLIRQENKGVSTARNVAIENCVSKYLMFLDADDQYHSEMLSFMVEEMGNNNVDLVSSKYMISDDLEEEFPAVSCKKDVITREAFYKMFNKKRVYKINFWNCIYRNDIIQKNNIRFNTDLKYGEDSLFLLTYIYFCKDTVEITDAVLYKYVMVKNSASKSRNYSRVQVIEAFKIAQEVWNGDKEFDKSVSQYAVDRAVWAQAKDFAIASSELFNKLCSEYDVYAAMQNMSKNCDEKMVKISSGVYCVSNKLFLMLMKVYSLVGKK